jgi:hypothetical protein
MARLACEVVLFRTQGDRVLDTPLPIIGEGLHCRVEAALTARSIGMHSEGPADGDSSSIEGRGRRWRWAQFLRGPAQRMCW